MVSGSDFFCESSYFRSASTSPQRLSMESHVSFYSVPPTPNNKLNLGPDADSFSDQDFEFDTCSLGCDGFITGQYFESPKKDKKEKQRLHRSTESMPAMSFADELFFNGKVKASPQLKPPPGSRSPAVAKVSTPRSPLSWRNNNLWNDDFDPFMAALESVKEDRNTRTHHHRARSMTLIDRTHNQSSVFYEHKQRKEVEEPKSPVQEKLAEPRGLDFTRRLRQVKTLAEEEGGGINGREAKRQKIMRFLTMRSRFLGKEEMRNGDGECHDSNTTMNGLLRRLRFNRSREMEKKKKKKKKKTVAMASSASATGNGSRAVVKVPVLQYMPRLLLCLGYGLRRKI